MLQKPTLFRRNYKKTIRKGQSVWISNRRLVQDIIIQHSNSSIFVLQLFVLIDHSRAIVGYNLPLSFDSLKACQHCWFKLVEQRSYIIRWGIFLDGTIGSSSLQLQQQSYRYKTIYVTSHARSNPCEIKSFYTLNLKVCFPRAIKVCNCSREIE